MACGGCKAKARRLRAEAAAKSASAPAPQALLRCPGCNALHSEAEYQKCPFRMQYDKQQAREQRIKALQPQEVKIEQNIVRDRRGVGPSQPANSDKASDNKKKW